MKGKVIVELQINGFFDPDTKKFCKRIVKDSTWNWNTLLIKPLTTRYSHLELDVIKQTSNKIKLYAKFKNRPITCNSAYMIMIRYLELNMKTIKSCGLFVEREI